MIRLLKEEDKQIILEYLHRNEIETSFLYANVIEFGVENRKDIRRCADYFGFFNYGNLAGIIPFYNLGSCIPHYETKDAIFAFVQLIQERSTGCLMGMDRIIRPIYQAINHIKEIAECNESSYFVNKNFKPYNVSDIKFIDPRQMADDERIIEFIIQVRNNGFHETINTEDARMGPLYHLTERRDRLWALEEAKRVLKPGGIVICAVISRFASMLDGFHYGLVSDPQFVTMMNQDLQCGQHRNDSEKDGYFTTAFLHHPVELKEEITDSGFDLAGLFAVEGFAGCIPEVEKKCEDKNYLEMLLDTLRKIESEDSLLGVSSHFIGIGKKRLSGDL